MADNSNPNFFSVAWSLSVEEWFYIIVPLLILIFYKFNKNFTKKLEVICIAIIIAGLTLKLSFETIPEMWGEQVRRSVLFRLDSICFGVLAFLWKEKLENITLLIIVIVTTFYVSFILFHPTILWTNKLIQALILPICSILFSSILIFLSRMNFGNRITIFGKYLGNISYSIYLFHIFFK